MRHFDSIQDLLKSLGYEEKQADRVFARGETKIPFDEIPKHSVATFLRKARVIGWVTDNEVRQVTAPAPPVIDPTGTKVPFSAYEVLSVEEDILTGRIIIRRGAPVANPALEEWRMR